MIRRLYDWTLTFAATPYAMVALAFVCVIESSVFPIPPDVLILPMVLAAREKAWRIATLATVMSVIGGGIGYYIGMALFDLIGQPVLEFYHKMDGFEAFKDRFNAQGHWAVLFAGVTPFPYKVITITSGATGLPFGQFMFWSLIARALRFFLLAGLLWYFGPPIRAFIEKRLGLMLTLGFVILIGGFYMVKFL